jgi:VWFA-related protein
MRCTLPEARTEEGWAVVHRGCRIAPVISAMGFLVLVGFALVRVASAQQGQPVTSSTPDHVAPLRVTTRLVQISVIVDDKHGNPITGLAKEDFVLLDDKELQEIQFFAKQSNRPTNQSLAPLPTDTFTNRIADNVGTPESVTVILLDALNTEFADQALARKQVLRFLQQIQPGDRVALYWLGNSLHVLHDFTADASILRGTLAGFAGESSESLLEVFVAVTLQHGPLRMIG